MIGQGLNCDEKGKLAEKDSEETFEEALGDEPNDENVMSGFMFLIFQIYLC